MKKFPVPTDEQWADWSAALLSGKFKQGKHRLFETSADYPAGRYCCLGVYGWVVLTDCYINNKATLGPDDMDPELQGVFVHLNDAQGWTFEEIANLAIPYIRNRLAQDKMITEDSRHVWKASLVNLKASI